MAKISISKRDVVWSYIGSFFRLGSNIIILPVILHFLSDDDLGMWYVFAGISQFVVLLDFGFAPALSRNIAYIWCGAKKLEKTDVSCYSDSNTDFVAFKKILETCRYIYLLLSIIAFILLASLGTFYINTLSTNSNNIKASWMIYGSGVILNLYYSYFTSFLRGVGAIAENNIANIISKLVQIILSCILLYMGYGLIGVSISYFFSGLVLRLYSIHAFNKYNGIGSSLRKIKIKNDYLEYLHVFTIIWHNASRDGLVTISNYLSTQANILISSSILGLATTGSYGLAVQIATTVSGIANIPYTTYQPKIQELLLNRKKKESLTLFSGSIIAYIFVYMTLSLICLLSIPLIIWIRPSLSMDYLILTVILLYMFIYHLFHLFASYISNSNKIPYTRGFIISSIITIVLSFLSAYFTKMGIWSLILPPLIVSLAYNAWKWPKYVFNENQIGALAFFFQGIEQFKAIMKKCTKQ